MRPRRATGSVYQRAETGWGWPHGAIRGHLFAGFTRSVCERWDFAGGLISLADVRPDELAGRCCAACVRAGFSKGILPYAAVEIVDVALDADSASA